MATRVSTSQGGLWLATGLSSRRDGRFVGQEASRDVGAPIRRLSGQGFVFWYQNDALLVAVLCLSLSPGKKGHV